VSEGAARSSVSLAPRTDIARGERTIRSYELASARSQRQGSGTDIFASIHCFDVRAGTSTRSEYTGSTAKKGLILGERGLTGGEAPRTGRSSRNVLTSTSAGASILWPIVSSMEDDFGS